MDGMARAKAWGLEVCQARYGAWGNWFAALTAFPAVLVDDNGYLLVQSNQELEEKGARLTKQINVSRGIVTLSGYVRMRADFPAEAVANGAGQYWEGAVQTVLVNRYERDARSRRDCLKHHGKNCAGCDLDMAALYGVELTGFIHVHHIVPLAQIGAAYKLNAMNDLVPLCPNCHAVVHRFSPVMSVSDLRRRLGRTSL